MTIATPKHKEHATHLLRTYISLRHFIPHQAQGTRDTSVTQNTRSDAVGVSLLGARYTIVDPDPDTPDPDT